MLSTRRIQELQIEANSMQEVSLPLLQLPVPPWGHLPGDVGQSGWPAILRPGTMLIQPVRQVISLLSYEPLSSKDVDKCASRQVLPA